LGRFKAKRRRNTTSDENYIAIGRSCTMKEIAKSHKLSNKNIWWNFSLEYYTRRAENQSKSNSWI